MLLIPSFYLPSYIFFFSQSPPCFLFSLSHCLYSAFCLLVLVAVPCIAIFNRSPKFSIFLHCWTNFEQFEPILIKFCPIVHHLIFDTKVDRAPVQRICSVSLNFNIYCQPHGIEIYLLKVGVPWSNILMNFVVCCVVIHG